MSSRARVNWATGRRASRFAPVAASLALALAPAVSGCGSDDEPAAADEASGVIDVSGTGPVGEMTAGSVAQLVQCRDWNRATPEQRLATIADVRSQINLEKTGVKATELTDEEAAQVFDNTCDEPHAQGYRLYLLYARAVGFAPLARELGD